MSDKDVVAQIPEGLIKGLLSETRKQRRASYFRTFALVGIVLSFLVYNLHFAARSPLPEGEAYVAMVRINGAIEPDSSASAQFLEPVLTEAFHDKKAEGVMLVINSPGGTPVQSHIIHQIVTRLKRETGQKVIVVAEDALTSGAYMLAVAADKIFVDPNTMVGSVGVVQQSYGYAGLMKQMGIEARVIKAGENKVRLDPLSPVDPKDVEKIQSVLDEVHQNFIQVVKDGRGERLDASYPGLFSGDYWTGQKAHSIGLVDGVSDFRGVLREEFGAEHALDYSRRRGFLGGLNGMFSKVLSEALSTSLQQMAATASPPRFN